MFALNAGIWPATSESPSDARDRYHRVALAEARVAAEHEPHVGADLARTSLVGRIRAALGFASSQPDSLACCA